MTVTFTPGPTQLAFTQQPSSTAPVGKPFSVQPKIAVQDVNGNRVTTDTSTVTLAIAPGSTGNGNLICTGGLKQVAVQGVASFTGCHFSAPGTYKIHAADGTLNPASSASVDVIKSYEVDIPFWIPQAAVVDPSIFSDPIAFGRALTQASYNAAPKVPWLEWLSLLVGTGAEPPACYAPTGLNTFSTYVSSNFQGDGSSAMPAAGESFRAYFVLTFDWDGEAVTNIDTSTSQAGTSNRLIDTTGPAGDVNCVVPVPGVISSLSPTVNNNADGTTLIQWQVVGTNPHIPFPNLVNGLNAVQTYPIPVHAGGLASLLNLLPAVPPAASFQTTIDATLDANGITLMDFGATTSFPSIGVRVLEDGDITTAYVLNDASCLSPTDVSGVAGAALLVYGFNPPFNSGSVPVGTTSGALESPLCSVPMPRGGGASGGAGASDGFGFAPATGSDVSVPLVDGEGDSPVVTMTFGDVLGTGVTEFDTTGNGMAPPAGFSMGTPPIFYDIASNVAYSGSIQVCINYSRITFPAPPHIFHEENGQWVDRTSVVTANPPLACAIVSSLSPFALFAPTSSEPVGGGCTVDCGPSPEATPEADSLLLLASGLASVAGFVVARRRPRRSRLL